MTGPEAMFGPSEGHVTAMEQCDPHWDTPGLSDVTVYTTYTGLVQLTMHYWKLIQILIILQTSYIIYLLYLFLEHREDLILICL